MRPLTRALPSLVTFAGLAVALGGFVWSPALAVLALPFDVLDGYLARRLGACSEFGAWLDWSVDAALAVVYALALWPMPVALVVVVTYQAAMRAYGQRSSGRASLACIWFLWGVG